MKKEILKNLQSKWNVLALALIAIMTIGFSSCGGDDEKIDDNTIGDFYFSFDLIDRGTFSEAEANQFMGYLNSGTDAMEGISKEAAIYVFDKNVESVRVAYSGSNTFEVTFKIKLMLNGKEVKSKIIEIKRNGCTVK